MQKGLLHFALIYIFAVNSIATKAKKITFSTATEVQNIIYYDKNEPTVGSQKYYDAQRWISVTSAGYETEGSMQELMDKMTLEDENNPEDPSFPNPKTDTYISNGNNEVPKDSTEPIKLESASNRNNESVLKGPNKNEYDTNMLYDDDSDDFMLTLDNVLEDREKRRIIGRDDRKKISYNDLRRFPFRTTGRIDIGCTGTFIRGRTVLTAGHCVHGGRRRRWYRNLNFRRAKNCDPNRGHCHYWSRAVTYVGWTRYSYKYYDIAVIIVRQKYYNFMSIGYWHPMPKTTVYINGYPNDKRGKCMWYTFCETFGTINKGRQIYYPCDTDPGMSGSPVYSYHSGDYIVYGVHAYGYRNHNRATRITYSHYVEINSWISAFKGC